LSKITEKTEKFYQFLITQINCHVIYISNSEKLGIWITLMSSNVVNDVIRFRIRYIRRLSTIKNFEVLCRTQKFFWNVKLPKVHFCLQKSTFWSFDGFGSLLFSARFQKSMKS